MMYYVAVYVAFLALMVAGAGLFASRMTRVAPRGPRFPTKEEFTRMGDAVMRAVAREQRRLEHKVHPIYAMPHAVAVGALIADGIITVYTNTPAEAIDQLLDLSRFMEEA